MQFNTNPGSVVRIQNIYLNFIRANKYVISMQSEKLKIS
jgi:hypothetical protein